MRIALLHNLLRGGAHTRTAGQVGYLGAPVTEYTLATASPITAEARVEPYRELAEAVRPGARPPLRYADLVRLLAAYRRVARAIDAGDYDAVLVSPCRFLQAPAAMRWLRTPTLYFCDEPRRVDYEPALRGSVNGRTALLYAPLRRAHREADRSAVRAATALATNSAFTAARIRDAYGVGAQVVGLGTDPVFTGEPHARGRHLLSVGTLIRTKGHHTALEVAARSASRWPLVVVAPRPEAAFQRELEARAAELGVPLTVRTGIPVEELVALFRDAQATLYLAEREPLGLVSLEAQAVGCPVVVSDEGGLPETVDDGRTGWAVPRTVEAATAAVDRLDDPATRERMSVAAIEHGRSHSWRSSGAELRRLLEAL